MKNLQFEMKDGKLHILDYPTADKIVTIPDTPIVRQLKDMILHGYDLNNAFLFLSSIQLSNPREINNGLLQSAIITYYKCFGSSKFRNNRLNESKILAQLPEGAKEVFDYYKNLRDKFIAHDESRYAQVYTGAILQSDKTPPFIDTVSVVLIADICDGEENQKGLQSFFNLIEATNKWVSSKIDELHDLLQKEYLDKDLSAFEEFESLTSQVPTADNMFSKRY